jgi:hypothetical protein
LITSRAISRQAIESAKHDVRLHAEREAAFLNHVREDVLYVSHLKSLDNLVEARANDANEEADYWQQQAQRDFLIFSAAHFF